MPQGIEFVAFDVETTGLSHHSDKIIEIGAVRFKIDGTELGRMQQLIDPGRRIPGRATEIHGITDDMVRGKPTIEKVLPEFINFLGTPNAVLLAHNAQFDVSFLSAALNAWKNCVPEHRVIDTLSFSKQRLPGRRSYKLGDLSKHFRVSTPKSHRAMADALTVKALFGELISLRPAIRRPDELFRVARILHFERSKPVTVPAKTALLTSEPRWKPVEFPDVRNVDPTASVPPDATAIADVLHSAAELCRVLARAIRFIPPDSPVLAELLKHSAAVNGALANASERLSARSDVTAKAAVTSPTSSEVLAEAIIKKLSLSVVYYHGKGQQSREIQPIRFSERAGSRYVIGRCHKDGSEKHIRVDKIVKVEVLPER